MELKVLTVCAFLLVSLCLQFGDALVTCDDEKAGVTWTAFCQLKTNEVCEQVGKQDATCVCKPGTTRIAGVCIDVHCSNVTTVPNGHVSGGKCVDAKLGDTCLFSCNPGYWKGEKKPNKDIQAVCQPDGRWNEDIRCHVVTCPTMKEDNGKVVSGTCNGANIGDTCKVSCTEKYFLVDGDKKANVSEILISCRDNGRWNKLVGCKEIYCPSPYRTEGVVVSGDCYYPKLGAKCDLSCKKGYDLMEGNRTLHVSEITMNCLKSGQWDRKLTCAEKGFCESLYQVLENPATVHVGGECRDATVGDNCSIGCKEGFRPAAWWNLTATDVMNATCLPSLEWNLQISCQKAPPCPDLSAPNGGFAVGECKGALTGQACYFACFPGFHLKGQSTLRCRSGDWNEPVPTCAVQSSCDGQHPSAGVSWNDFCRRNGRVCVPSSEPEQVMCGDCIPGHQPSEDESQKCLAVSCPDLIAPIGGLHLGECRGALNGQSCYFACYPGYNLTGNSTLRCQSGKWDGTAPTCTAANSCEGLKRPDGESWTSFCEKQPNRVCMESPSGEPRCVCKDGCREDTSGCCACSPRRIHIQEFRSILVENRRRRQAEN